MQSALFCCISFSFFIFSVCLCVQQRTNKQQSVCRTGFAALGLAENRKVCSAIAFMLFLSDIPLEVLTLGSWCLLTWQTWVCGAFYMPLVTVPSLISCAERSSLKVPAPPEQNPTVCREDIWSSPHSLRDWVEVTLKHGLLCGRRLRSCGQRPGW